MKLSSAILLVTFIFLVTAMFASNLMLKKEYDKVDKSDLYWTYGKILQQPFRHLKIEGGNITNIAFEQSSKPSVRIFKNWAGFETGSVKTFVKDDTLFVNIRLILSPQFLILHQLQVFLFLYHAYKLKKQIIPAITLYQLNVMMDCR